MVLWDQLIIKFLSILTLIGTVILGLYILNLIFYKITRQTFFLGLWSHIGKKSLDYIFLISFLSMLGSLIFSELLNFTPCYLCWFQRIFMYPQVFLSGLAIIRKEKKILPYLLTLSIIGALIAGFHSYNQIAETSLLPCSALGNSASCSEFFFLEFGYITIPMMEFTAFAALLISQFLYKKLGKHTN